MSETRNEPGALLSRRALITLGVLAVATMAVVGWGRDVVGAVADAHGAHAAEHPWAGGGDAVRVYGWMPAVVLSAVILWILPGIFLVLAFGCVRTWTSCLVLSLPMAWGAQAGATTLARIVGGVPLGRDTLFLASVLVTVAAYGLLWWRGRERPSPFVRGERTRLAATVLVPALAFLALLPWLLWQNFNDDGWEALYVGESLFHHGMPRWPVPAGVQGLGLGMISSAFVSQWFIGMFGVTEAAPRLPLLLGVTVLWAAIVELAETGTGRRLGPGALVAVTLAVGGYLAAMACSAGYNPYFCDPASPGAIDTLHVAFLLGMVICLVQKRLAGFLAFVLLAHFCRPSAMLVLGLFFVATVLAGRGERKRWLAWTVVAIGLCFVGTFVYERLYLRGVLGVEEIPHASGGVLSRYRYVTISDLSRLAFLVVPCGLVPAVGLVFWKSQDRLARVLTLVTAAYFAAFYVPAFISVHHFVPVMVLPAVIFWRMVPGLESGRGWITVAAIVGGVAGVWLSLPEDARVDRTYRDLGSRITVSVTAEDPWKDPRKRGFVLKPVVFDEGPREDPATKLVGTPWSAWRYTRAGDPTAESLFHVVMRGEPGPAGWTLVTRPEDAAFHGLELYRRAPSAWRPKPPPTGFAARVYTIDRDVLHRHRGIVVGRFDYDLRRSLPFFKD